MTIPPSTVARHVRLLTPAATGPRVVCFPHAGGAAYWFRTWAEHVVATHTLLAVQYPGRQDLLAEPHPPTIQHLAEVVADELADDGPAPTVLFGHSLGASVAYEVAQVLTAARRPPEHLVVSARPGPADHRFTGKDAWPATELWADMVDLGGTPAELAGVVELRDVVVPVLRRDYRLADNYSPSSTVLACRVTAVTGADDPEATPAQMRSWSAVTTGTFTHHVVPGGHFHLGERPGQTVRIVLG